MCRLRPRRDLFLDILRLRCTVPNKLPRDYPWYPLPGGGHLTQDILIPNINDIRKLTVQATYILIIEKEVSPHCPPS
jgi:hypothetical protein